MEMALEWLDTFFGSKPEQTVLAFANTRGLHRRRLLEQLALTSEPWSQLEIRQTRKLLPICALACRQWILHRKHRPLQKHSQCFRWLFLDSVEWLARFLRRLCNANCCRRKSLLRHPSSEWTLRGLQLWRLCCRWASAYHTVQRFPGKLFARRLQFCLPIRSQVKHSASQRFFSTHWDSARWI